MKNLSTVVTVIGVSGLVAAAPASAHGGPSVRSDADVVAPGHRYVLRGEGWFVGSRCGSRVRVSQRAAHGVGVGSARIHDNGSFTFSHAVPRAARRGARMVLDVTQRCDGVGTTRTVRSRIGRDRHGCGRPLEGDRIFYEITVIGGLACGAGENAVGLFIDTGTGLDGWTCAHIGASDFACVESLRPGRRVEARGVREL